MSLSDHLWGVESEQEMLIFYLHEIRSCLLRSFSLGLDLKTSKGAEWD